MGTWLGRESHGCPIGHRHSTDMFSIVIRLCLLAVAVGRYVFLSYLIDKCRVMAHCGLSTGRVSSACWVCTLKGVVVLVY